MNRRIKALDTLRRVERNQLESIAQNLGQMRAVQDAARNRIEALSARAALEASSSATEALPYIGRFLTTLRREQTRESKVVRDLEGGIEALRMQVEEHFKSERTYERLADEALTQIKLERAQKAESALEDMIQSRFGRV